MTFALEKIDRAIVYTQHDLRGFVHPLGFRQDPGMSAKALHATLCNMVAIAAGLGTDEDEVHEGYVDWTTGPSYDQYLIMCHELAGACTPCQKEGIQLILKEAVKQRMEMSAKIDAGDMEPSDYLAPLEKGNRVGQILVALTEAFELSLTDLLLAKDVG